MVLHVRFDIEEDGRHMALVDRLPGVMVYGATREEALANVRSLVAEALAEGMLPGRLASGLAGRTR